MSEKVKVSLYKSPNTGRGLLYTEDSMFTKNPALLAIYEIGEFNRRMSENPLELLALQNRAVEFGLKNRLIKTFINQLYDLIEKKKNGEYN